jgi:2-dehydropantoate 2-reductase
MGQVPNTAVKKIDSAGGLPRQETQIARRYLVVGDGRMARHFIQYFSLISADRSEVSSRYAVTQWSRKMPIPLEEAAQDCDTVLLLIKDGSIENFVQENPGLQGKRLIHFSGALVTPCAHGFHPLMTFGESYYPVSMYESIPFIGEEKGPSFKEVFPFLRNPYFAISPECKPYYHSLCVLAGNFTVLLWQKMFSELESRFKIPAEAAFPYLSQIAVNLIKNSDSALTGPFQRGDWSTIEKNLSSLGGDPYEGVYRAFAQAALPGLTAKFRDQGSAEYPNEVPHK